MFQQLSSVSGCLLEAALLQGFLAIRVSAPFDKNCMKLYEAKIKNIAEVGELRKYCDKFQDLIEYMRDPNNAIIDTKNCLLTIIAKKTIMKKQQVINLALIKLQYIKTIQKGVCENAAKSIAQKCSQKSTLSSQDMKQMFEMVAGALKNLLEQKNQINNEMIKSQQVMKKVQKELSQLKGSTLKKMQQSQKNVLDLRQQIKQQAKTVSDLSNKVQKIQRQKNEREAWCQQQRSNIMALSNKITELQIKITRMQNGKFSPQKIEENMDKLNSTMKQKKKEQLQQKDDRLATALKGMQQDLAKDITQKKEAQEKQKKMKKSSPSKPKQENPYALGPVDAKKWVDPNCQDFLKLRAKNNTISHNAQKMGDVHIYGRKQIGGSFSACFKNISEGCYVYVGLADSQYKSKKNILSNSCPNRVLYLNNGDCHVCSNYNYKAGKGFRQGELVTVTADLETGTVSFFVEGQLSYQVVVNQLKSGNQNRKSLSINPNFSNSIEWVPFILLFGEKSAVSIFQ